MTTYRLLFIHVIFLLGFSNFCIGQSIEIDQQKIDRIRQEILSTIKKENIPSVCIAIAGNNDHIEFLNFGHFDRSLSRKVDEKSLFQIASLGKMFIGIVANNLMKEGVIKSDQAITNFLDHEMSDRTFKKLNKITIIDLLHHNAGVPGDGKSGYRRKDGDPYLNDYSEADFEAELKKMRIKSAGKYKYSNLGYALLAFVMEKATNKSYEELLIKYVVEPYNLEATHLQLPKEKKNLVVTPYRKYQPTIETKGWSMGKLGPPSAVYSCTEDLSKLILAQVKAYRDLPESQDHPLVLTNNLTIKSSEYKIYYGFGMVQWTPEIFGHAGEMDSYGSDYSINVPNNFGVALLTSCAGDWVSPLVQKITRILRE